MIKFKCSKCSQEVTFEVFKINPFCPNCGGHIEKAYITNPPSGTEVGGRKKLTPMDAQVAKLWPVYLNSEIKISAGYTFPSVDEWVKQRRQVYLEYRKKFVPNNLQNIDLVKRNFQSWLLFRNNLSWTTLQRTATNALNHPQRLSKLLLSLQNENIDVASRVRSGLQGSDKINGLGQGILTALLHTFNDEEYGVWNSRTSDTLSKLHHPIFSSDDIGDSYVRVNSKLISLAKELETNLTTLDGFMWFVSKNYEFL